MATAEKKIETMAEFIVWISETTAVATAEQLLSEGKKGIPGTFWTWMPTQSTVDSFCYNIVHGLPRFFLNFVGDRLLVLEDAQSLIAEICEKAVQVDSEIDIDLRYYLKLIDAASKT